MYQKKIIINNKIYEVVGYDDYIENQNIFDPQFTAIETEDYVLPIVPPTLIDNNIGIVCQSNNTAMYQVHLPPQEEMVNYSKENIIDYSKAKNIKELMEMQESIRNLENEILVSPENIYVPRIDVNDTPEMKALKEAITAKGIDLKKYKQRFGINFPNDVRGLNEDSVSFKKLKRYAEKFDMKVELTISDTSPDVPNPMKKVITKVITEGDE